MDERRGGWDSDEPQVEASLVRPYILTAGRTDSRVELPLEAPIKPIDRGPAPRWPANDAHTRILRLAESGPSVAEISARLAIPLGVARVLISDLVVQGYLRVHATLSESASTDERRELIGRTLRGLRAL